MRTTVFSAKAPKPVGPYNQAVMAGKFLFVSVQLAFDQKEGKTGTKYVMLQTRRVMDNIAILVAT